VRQNIRTELFTSSRFAIWISFFLSLVGAGLEGYCCTWSHSMTHTHTRAHSVEFLWTISLSVTETSTWQYATLIRDAVFIRTVRSSWNRKFHEWRKHADSELLYSWLYPCQKCRSFGTWAFILSILCAIYESSRTARAVLIDDVCSNISEILHTFVTFLCVIVFCMWLHSL
jgi:hypothetical protein